MAVIKKIGTQLIFICPFSKQCYHLIPNHFLWNRPCDNHSRAHAHGANQWESDWAWKPLVQAWEKAVRSSCLAVTVIWLVQCFKRDNIPFSDWMIPDKNVHHCTEAVARETQGTIGEDQHRVHIGRFNVTWIETKHWLGQVWNWDQSWCGTDT